MKNNKELGLCEFCKKNKGIQMIKCIIYCDHVVCKECYNKLTKEEEIEHAA